MPPTKGDNYVPTTMQRNGGGKSRDFACRSIIFYGSALTHCLFSLDYLQVFELSTERGRLRIVHAQEYPDYRKEYMLRSDVPITAKLYVINDTNHATMLFCEEY